MVELQAVVEVTGGHVVLSGRMSQEEVGVVLAAIADHGSDEGELDAEALLRAVLEEEMITAEGGLRVRHRDRRPDRSRLLFRAGGLARLAGSGRGRPAVAGAQS